MAKPPSITVPSDDYEVVVDGKTYSPHEGEWVVVTPGATVASNRNMRTLVEMIPRLQAAEGEPDEQQQTIVILDDVNIELLEFLADRLVAWNWTDHRGRPLPELDGTTDPFARLPQQEVMYLVRVCQGQAPAVEKKDMSNSPTTSSATEPQPIRTPSSTDRSLTKVS